MVTSGQGALHLGQIVPLVTLGQELRRKNRRHVTVWHFGIRAMEYCRVIFTSERELSSEARSTHNQRDSTLLLGGARLDRGMCLPTTELLALGMMTESSIHLQCLWSDCARLPLDSRLRIDQAAHARHV